MEIPLLLPSETCLFTAQMIDRAQASLQMGRYLKIVGSKDVTVSEITEPFCGVVRMAGVRL